MKLLHYRSFNLRFDSRDHKLLLKILQAKDWSRKMLQIKSSQSSAAELIKLYSLIQLNLT